VYFLFEVFICKNVSNTTDNIQQVQKQAFKAKRNLAVSGYFGIQISGALNMKEKTDFCWTLSLYQEF
jgi:hypothetical protein